jgi:hypothetical protein
MDQHSRDKTKVDPLTGGEEKEPTPPLQTVPPGQDPNATSAVIPGTGEVIHDDAGKEAKRVVGT